MNSQFLPIGTSVAIEQLEEVEVIVQHPRIAD